MLLLLDFFKEGFVWWPVTIFVTELCELLLVLSVSTNAKDMSSWLYLGNINAKPQDLSIRLTQKGFIFTYSDGLPK